MLASCHGKFVAIADALQDQSLLYEELMFTQKEEERWRRTFCYTKRQEVPRAGLDGVAQTTTVYSVSMDGSGSMILQITGITDTQVSMLNRHAEHLGMLEDQFQLAEVWDRQGGTTTGAIVSLAGDGQLRQIIVPMLNTGIFEWAGVTAEISYFIGRPTASVDPQMKRVGELKML